MARPRRTRCISLRLPNADHAEVVEWAEQCEWALNSELVAAVQAWRRQSPEWRAAERFLTKAAAETEAGRGYQHQSGKYAREGS